MTVRSNAVTKDEELGKRDDDYDSKGPGQRPSITPRITWRKWRKRLILAGVIVAIYLMVRDTSARWTSTNLMVPAEGHHVENVRIPNSQAPAGMPPRDGGADEEEEQRHYYNGKTRFYSLANSLKSIKPSLNNRNVLFASTLHSISSLIPMACEMASTDKNHVHVALLGRSSLSLEEVVAINAVDAKACNVHWHDARPDYAQYSSDMREVTALKMAIKHISEYIHPQAVIMDDSAVEDPLFSKTVRTACSHFGYSMIEIPSGMYEEFFWITRLDAESLSRWTLPSIHVVIRARPGSSGGLIRLLKSLAQAHYRGLKMPHLTIELPPRIDGALQRFLTDFKWPPDSVASTSQSNLLSIHHRIRNSRLNPEESSLRFGELFYPSQPEHDNVLVLSPHVELSPTFLHFLHYQILGYRYATFFGGLAGIALSAPQTSLIGNETLRIPTLSNGTFAKTLFGKRDDPNDASPFLYNAPSSSATLFFGEKWASLHDFLSKRLEMVDSGNDSETRKLVPESEPAWMEYLLELMSVRGWNVLHPASAFVTVHNEQAEVQEEFGRARSGEDTRELDDVEVPEGASSEVELDTEPVEQDMNHKHVPLHQLLPFDGNLPPLWSMPQLNYNGSTGSGLLFGSAKEQELVKFRKAHGGCQGSNATRRRVQNALNTDDLFCLPGVKMDFVDEHQ